MYHQWHSNLSWPILSVRITLHWVMKIVTHACQPKLISVYVWTMSPSLSYWLVHLLTHRSQVTHICVSKLCHHIGSHNGIQRWLAVNWTIRNIFQENCYYKSGVFVQLSSVKWRPFCPGLNVPISSWDASSASKTIHTYRQSSSIRRTKSQNLKLSLSNPLKPGVKSRMKMLLEQRRQAMLQLHLSDH